MCRTLLPLSMLLALTLRGAELSVTYAVTNPGTPRPIKNTVLTNEHYRLERLESEQFSEGVLFDYDNGLIHFINYTMDTSTSAKVEEMQQELDDWDQSMDTLGPEARPLKADPAGVTDLKIDVLKEATVLNRKCKHVRFSARGVKAEVWYDETLKPTVPKEKLIRFQRVFQAAQVGMLYQQTPVFGACLRISDEMANLDGTIMKSVIQLPPGRGGLGGKMEFTMEATGIGTDPFPPGTFKIPGTRPGSFSAP